MNIHEVSKIDFFCYFCNEKLIKTNNIMSKTIELQIEKSRVLIEGLRNHVAELSDKGISVDQLDQMTARLADLKAANEECDALRAELSNKVKNMNKVLLEVKDSFATKKKVIKGYYPQEEWSRYGVMDKR